MTKKKINHLSDSVDNDDDVDDDDNKNDWMKRVMMIKKKNSFSGNSNSYCKPMQNLI